uniref:Uncharacterized protein n=1 Tax=Nelumbo nucifera TaxID=4432 RepID=A0A822XY78_NELNU|nr:TPA_asm: hypothetical protein HUJ06_025419 [Nelumbo nucifera]
MLQRIEPTIQNDSKGDEVRGEKENDGLKLWFIRFDGRYRGSLPLENKRNRIRWEEEEERKRDFEKCKKKKEGKEREREREMERVMEDGSDLSPLRRNRRKEKNGMKEKKKREERRRKR